MGAGLCGLGKTGHPRAFPGTHPLAIAALNVAAREILSPLGVIIWEEPAQLTLSAPRGAFRDLQHHDVCGAGADRHGPARWQQAQGLPVRRRTAGRGTPGKRLGCQRRRARQGPDVVGHGRRERSYYRYLLHIGAGMQGVRPVMVEPDNKESSYDGEMLGYM